MEFEIRELKARDVAPMARIINSIGLKQIADSLSPESLREIITAVDVEKTEDEAVEGNDLAARTEEIGLSVLLEVASIICANLDKAESDIFRFLASMAQMKEKEVAELSLADTLDLIVAVFTSEGFSDFFMRVRALLAK